jgi:hypothetical protein
MPRILPPDSAGSSKGSGSRDLYPVSRKGFLPPLSMDTSEAGFEFKVVYTVYDEKPFPSCIEKPPSTHLFD